MLGIFHPWYFKIHSSSYRKPSQLRPGNAVVVGGGNSGSQIAVELTTTRQVYLSVGKKRDTYRCPF
ncbi:hypothetical protein KY492_27630 [Brevibacterium sp. PAMC21349]|nr:hypothetical protein KY492_27630 [Brevibacterium sp. PAMC21349]